MISRGYVLREETEQDLGRQTECIFFLIHARSVVCIMPGARQPYAVVVVFHFDGVGRHLKQAQ